MTYVTIRDNALLAKHIEGDPEAVRRILDLPQNAEIVLMIEGTPIRFAKMRDGADGRATPGLRPANPEAKRIWDGLQEQRGTRVSVRLIEDLPRESQLASMTSLLAEWNTPEDAAAYDGL